MPNTVVTVADSDTAVGPAATVGSVATTDLDTTVDSATVGDSAIEEDSVTIAVFIHPRFDDDSRLEPIRSRRVGC